ncbi:MAG: hypothetical protein NVSMB65_06330 [Chloroflexota bacterium]
MSKHRRHEDAAIFSGSRMAVSALALVLLGVLGALGWTQAAARAPLRGAGAPHRGAGAMATFSGLVQDATTKMPISGAKVTIGRGSALTDSSGHYTLSIPAGTAFHATAAAPGYLPMVVDLSANGGVLRGAIHWDFTGPYGLKALGHLTAVLSGRVLDAQTGGTVGGAVVMAPGARTTADSSGHYQLTVPSTARLQLQAAAVGYQWRPPLTLSPVGQTTLEGTITFDFKGSGAGLWSAFHTPRGDTLARFAQLIPAARKALAFTGSSAQEIETSFAVTFPRGDASLLNLTVSHGRFAGQVPLTHGAGIYQLEINAGSGFALFNVPVFYGIPYAPPPMPPLYPAAAPTASAAQLAREALAVLNGLRARYRLPLFTTTPRLLQEAQAHSADVVAHNYYDQHPHVGSNGSTTGDRLRAAHVAFDAAGEDVAADSSVRGAIDGLMMSPGHRANILWRTFTRVGIGVARQPNNILVITIDFVHPA